MALGCYIAARADLGRWIQDIPAPSRLQAVFFRSVRRPPKETLRELTRLISTSPTDAHLYALRAQEDEPQLDFTAAESDWKKHAELATNKTAAALSLADFYHRRIRPREEITALDTVARAPSPDSEKLIAAPEQQSWRAFERIQAVIADQALPADFAAAEYRAWVARYPETTVYQ